MIEAHLMAGNDASMPSPISKNAIYSIQTLEEGLLSLLNINVCIIFMHVNIFPTKKTVAK